MVVIAKAIPGHILRPEPNGIGHVRLVAADGCASGSGSGERNVFDRKIKSTFKIFNGRTLRSPLRQPAATKRTTIFAAASAVGTCDDQTNKPTYFLCNPQVTGQSNKPLLSLIFTKKIKDSKRNLPPSPLRIPIIGNLHQLQGLFHRCLHDLSKKHGPVLLLRLGFLDILVISSKKAAEEALKLHDHECCTRPKTKASTKFSRDGKDIVFAPYGEVSRELRKLSGVAEVR
ncbi:hypothetical protein CARUB_v10018944mg [Capsella rubella]|uniref:Uncharacterized protein n=1 Tax=Capsella rubella TaxID=81985 RepID=R0FT31_9BRAS|nr:hypothetical protein CARUB_v10018944mg [Capsella rubella]